MRGYSVVAALPKPPDGPALLSTQWDGVELAWARPEDIAEILEASPAGVRSWREDWRRGGYLASLSDRLDPQHTALLMIDIQNDFCRTRILQDDTLNLISANVPRMARLLGAARNAGCTVVHVHAEYGLLFRGPGAPRRFKVAHQDEIIGCLSAAELDRRVDLPDGTVDEVCLTGSWGEAPLPEVAPRPGEMIVRKHRYSAFIGTGLAERLRRHSIRTVVLCGVATNVCVDTSARDAAMMDFYVVVADDAVAVRDPATARHTAALVEVRLGFGITAPTGRIIQTWQEHLLPLTI